MSNTDGDTLFEFRGANVGHIDAPGVLLEIKPLCPLAELPGQKQTFAVDVVKHAFLFTIYGKRRSNYQNEPQLSA
jgi:hypothetical protein